MSLDNDLRLKFLAAQQQYISDTIEYGSNPRYARDYSNRYNRDWYNRMLNNNHNHNNNNNRNRNRNRNDNHPLSQAQHRTRETCKKIKRAPKLYKINGKRYKPYQIEWILANNKLLPRHSRLINSELSHICGNTINTKSSSCIESTHQFPDATEISTPIRTNICSRCVEQHCREATVR